MSSGGAGDGSAAQGQADRCRGSPSAASPLGEGSSSPALSPQVRFTRALSFGEDDELIDDRPASWTLKRFQAQVVEAMREYFVAQDVDDAVCQARELLAECPQEADEFSVVAIREAIDHAGGAEATVVKFLCALRKSGVVEAPPLVRAFEKLFVTWEDIAIDAPKAPQALLSILIGCIEGDVVHRSLLTKLPENLMNATLSKGESTQQHAMIAEVYAELKEFKRLVASCVELYFLNRGTHEVRHRLKEIGMRPFLHEFVKKLITASLSEQDARSGREAVVALLQVLLSEGHLEKDDVQLGITRVLGQLDDLELDCPHVADLMTDLLESLVADALVSAPFLRRCRLLRIGGLGGLRVLVAVQRRTPEICKKHLGAVEFERELNMMILEYFDSGDQVEFGRCVRDLAPLTEERSADLIVKLMSLAMERSAAKRDMASRLLVWLCRQEELSEHALTVGFDELYRRMPDLLLDAPEAQEMARTFVEEAKKHNVLREDWPAPVMA